MRHLSTKPSIHPAPSPGTFHTQNGTLIGVYLYDEPVQVTCAWL